MICFRDMTFCASDCTNEGCRRHFGQRDEQEARRWWGPENGEPPVAFSDFSDNCAEYAPEVKT